MIRYTVLGTALSLLIVSVISMLAVIVSTDINSKSVQSEKNDVVIYKGSNNEEKKQTYYLKEHDGKLAIFIDNQSLPAEIFNVYIKTLPQFDQGQLEQGIKVEGYEELASLIEDYIS